MQTVLVTGGAGYIGSTLCGALLKSGYRVICLDRLFFTTEPLKSYADNENFSVIKEDIRNVTPETFKGVDIVIDLAGISNDPACDLDPQLTEAINHNGTVHVAKTARMAGVSRYVMASSCSAYGAGSSEQLTEESKLQPVSLYAKAKVDSEKDILPL